MESIYVHIIIIIIIFYVYVYYDCIKFIMKSILSLYSNLFQRNTSVNNDMKSPIGNSSIFS